MKRTNWKLIVAGLVWIMIVAITQVYSQGTRASQTPTQTGPYVLFYAESGTFLLNSQTGQTWMLVIQDSAGSKRFVFSQVLRSDGVAAPNQ